MRLKSLKQLAAQHADNQFQIIRARYIVLLLFYTGLRIFEAAQHQMGYFIQRDGNWFLRVIGKGKKYVKFLCLMNYWNHLWNLD